MTTSTTLVGDNFSGVSRQRFMSHRGAFVNYSAVILNLIGGFRAFDMVYVLTRGGPAHYSEVLASYLYYYSFAAGGPNKMGVGASVAFVIFACILTIALARIIISKRIERN